MKGKRLYQLINELNKTEHRQLVNHCNLSSDKRAIALGELLRIRNLTETGFEKWLLLLVKSWNIQQSIEQEKKQRRWVDFACKEIEQLLLKNHFAESDARHYQLANLFDKRNHEELTTYYNEQSLQTASDEKNLNSILNGYDIQLRWLSRNQTKANIAQIGSLLVKRKQATELSYHEAMSYFYSVSSALYIDNPNAEAYKKIMPDEQQLLALRNDTSDEYSQILYLLAQTRFSFYQQPLFEQHLKETFIAIHNGKLNEGDKHRLERSCLYLRITGGLYYGFDLKKMIKHAEDMLVIMLRYKIYDSVGFFFLLFFVLVDNNLSKYDALLKKHKSAFFNNENTDYPLFLESLRIYLKEGSDKALGNLQKTCYSKSLYVAAWSKLLEIKIHAERNDDRFVKVLTTKAKRFIKTNSDHRLIAEPVLHVLNAFDQKKDDKIKKNNHTLFAYYAMFLKT